jgi:hypothetical protein
VFQKRIYYYTSLVGEIQARNTKKAEKTEKTTNEKVNATLERVQVRFVLQKAANEYAAHTRKRARFP